LTTTDRALPALRSDIEILSSGRWRASTYVLRDPGTGWVFELTDRDCFVCRQLDGQTTLDAIRDRYESEFGEPLPDKQVSALLEQLGQGGLLTEAVGRSEQELEDAFGPDHQPATRIVTLPNVDPFFTWLAPHVAWLFTRGFVLTTIPFVLVAFWILLRNWSRWTTAFEACYDLANLFWLATVGLLFVMIPRELVQGLACTHYGGIVLAAGIRFRRVRPQVFVDVTSARWLPKNRRMKTVFARGWVPMVVWTIGTIQWWLTTPGTRVNLFWLFLSVTGGWSTLWNWNPKLPSDGYRLLAYWLEVPRLRQRALRLAYELFLRWKVTEYFTPRELLWFAIFGVGGWAYAFVHAWLVWGAMGTVLVKLLQGWGALMMTVLVLLMVPHRWYRPLRPLKRPARWLLASEARMSIRIATRVALLVILVIVMFLPYPYDTGGSFKVLPMNKVEVHIDIEGALIQRVPIREGGWVKVGDVLAEVESREFQKTLDTTQAQLDSTKAQLALLRKQMAILSNPPNIEDVQRLEAEVRRLTAEVANARRELELTVLRAPIEGKVITPHVDKKVGQYLKKGDLLATLEDARTVDIETSVPEGDVPEVRPGTEVRAVAWAYPDRTFKGEVYSIASTATAEGALIVVRVLARLPNPDDLLKSEMTGYAKIRVGKKPVWDVLSGRLLRWLRVEVWYWIP